MSKFIKPPKNTTQKGGSFLVRFRMVSLEFFIDIILSAALWPWDRFSF